MSSEAVTVEGQRLGEDQRVILWRARELARAGYSALAADAISARTEIDLHRAVALARNGCPADLALRILL
jgi:hypothetical protein